MVHQIIRTVVFQYRVGSHKKFQFKVSTVDYITNSQHEFYVDLRAVLKPHNIPVLQFKVHNISTDIGTDLVTRNLMKKSKSVLDDVVLDVDIVGRSYTYVANVVDNIGRMVVPILAL
ncbi:hypothetical protein M8J75_011689 [Diaphorina citri]|nr:hypothetical protein M8J75_011689 [Diaphorina citri]